MLASKRLYSEKYKWRSRCRVGILRAAMTLWWAGRAEKAPGSVMLERPEPAHGKCCKIWVCAIETGLQIFWFMSREATWWSLVCRNLLGSLLRLRCHLSTSGWPWLPHFPHVSDAVSASALEDRAHGLARASCCNKWGGGRQAYSGFFSVYQLIIHLFYSFDFR